MNPVGADFGSLSAPASFTSRSTSTARSSEAAAGTPWKEKAARNAGAQRAHRGVMLAEHLVGIELLRARQRLRFGDAGAETLPRDDRGDRVEWVLPGLARRDQGGADPRIKTNLLVDCASVGLKGAGMPGLGLGEHRSDEAFEQVDRLIGQGGAELRG